MPADGRIALPDDAALVLRTDRLELRPTTVEDAPRFWPHVADPRVTRFVTWVPHPDLDHTRAWLRQETDLRRAGRNVVWVVSEDGAFRGVVGLTGLAGEFATGAAFQSGEIGYWLGMPFHGRGLATEAVRAAAACAFRQIRLERLWARVMSRNPESARVLEKCGFREVGLERRKVRWRGRWHDCRLFDRVRAR
ncbi:MAG: hypothetical protein HMLKMBBP_00692 [Planctomycetes bacterium]|nr:hypothetical protein [Planctomycetota bacterium]